MIRAPGSAPAHSGQAVPPTVAEQLADAYLAGVATRLPGPSRARGGIIAELRAGLLDATGAHHHAGLPVGSAAAPAVSEFGDPRQVAAAFRPGLAISQARRVALTLLATGPLIGLLWVATAWPATSASATPGPGIGPARRPPQ
jgi:hypothetical protein